MAFSISLNKLKAFFPVAVVGGAVAITIKLLTQENLLASNLLNVEAQEDIKLVDNYEEVLEEPEPEPEEAPPAEEQPLEDSSEEEEGEKEESSEGDSNEENEEQKQEQAEQQEEQQEKPNLTFKEGPLGNIFKEIFE